MPQQIEVEIKWDVIDDEYICTAKAVESRTHRVLAQVTVQHSVYTELDYKALFGEDLKVKVENAVKSIVINIAEKTTLLTND